MEEKRPVPKRSKHDLFTKKLSKIDRTEQPVVDPDESSHEQTMLNEVNMDFRLPGLAHSVVKHAEGSRVRELIKKIENHPHRQSLQQDLRQNKAYNPFSAESKRMIQEVVSVELFELFETDPKTQLHMRTFLQRNSGQSTFHWIHIGPFNSRIRHQEGKTSRPQNWEKPRDKEYYTAYQLKNKRKKR